jgi:hypothetical protein
MADWQMKGVYFKSCNCAPGCPCDFMSPPTQGPCEGFIGMRVDEGNFDGVSLAGSKWCVAFHWPGPLHEGNGTVKPYLDPSMTEAQMNSIGQILSGEVGGSWFEVLASIVTEVKEPAVVPIDFQVEGRQGTITVGDAMANSFGPIKNPVTGAEETVRVAIPGGLEYSRGDGIAEILVSDKLRSTDEIAFDHGGVHTSLVTNQDWGSDR